MKEDKTGMEAQLGDLQKQIQALQQGEVKFKLENESKELSLKDTIQNYETQLKQAVEKCEQEHDQLEKTQQEMFDLQNQVSDKNLQEEELNQ